MAFGAIAMTTRMTTMQSVTGWIIEARPAEVRHKVTNMELRKPARRRRMWQRRSMAERLIK